MKADFCVIPDKFVKYFLFFDNFVFPFIVVNKTKGWISKLVFKKIKHVIFPEKRTFLAPWYALPVLFEKNIVLGILSLGFFFGGRSCLKRDKCLHWHKIVESVRSMWKSLYQVERKNVKLQGGPQKCPYFSLAITFPNIRKPSRFFLHSYWKFIEFFWWKPL